LLHARHEQGLHILAISLDHLSHSLNAFATAVEGNLKVFGLPAIQQRSLWGIRMRAALLAAMTGLTVTN